MKTMKKIFALLIGMVMVLGMGTAVFAAGTGTITVENATYGKEYKAYKVFDATYSGDAVSYTVDATHKEFVSTDLFKVSTAADANGNYSVSKKDDTVTDALIISWLQDNYSKFDATGVTGTFQADNATVKFTNMPYGYYYVTSTLGSAIAIDTAKPDATIKDKNASAPTDPVKAIVSVDGTPKEDVSSADAHVGSVIGFKVTGNATNWTTSGSGNNVTATQNTAYTFEDTPTNMTIDANSVKVKMNGTKIAADAFTATVGEDGKLTVNIPLVKEGAVIYPANGENSAYIPVEVTYTGTITAAAASAPAKNEIGDSTVEIDTYAFQVAKTDGKDPLAGAKFELWKDGAALKFTDDGNGVYTYSATGTITTLDMTTNTTITIKGLDNSWTYTLKETKAPDGYNQAEDISVAGTSLTKVNDDISKLTLYKETVVNQQGVVLPSTGGMGTTIFYVIGAILVIGAGVVLVTRRRMRNAK